MLMLIHNPFKQKATTNTRSYLFTNHFDYGSYIHIYEHAYSQFIQTISNRNSETHVLTSALQPRTLTTRTPRFYSICCNTCVDRKCHREVAKLDVYSKYLIHSRCYEIA